MGSGKSTLAQKLAPDLDMPVLDTDVAIEHIAGKSVASIFRDDGESVFRDYERRLADTFTTLAPHIISTGGGFLTSARIAEGIPSLGYVVWLRATPATLWGRLQEDTTRPLLATDSPMLTLENLCKARYPVYEHCSDLILDTDSERIEALAHTICTNYRIFSKQSTL